MVDVIDASVTSDITKFKLSKPIQTHKGQIDELELKEPTGRAFVRYGTFFTTETVYEGTTRKSREVWDFPALFGFVSEMTSIGQLELQAIAGRDVYALAGTVLGMITAARPQ